MSEARHMNRDVPFRPAWAAILLARWLIEIVKLPLLMAVAWASRLARRPVDVGLGPTPMINNVYHQQALRQYGYSAETFVDTLYYITDEFDWKFIASTALGRRLMNECHFVFLFAIFRYRALYLYFTGGPLQATAMLWRFEPLLYRIAGIRTVVMPFGGDVHDLRQTRNLLFRHAMARDYPLHRVRQDAIRAKIGAWSRHASHVISGCDWVEYMPYWDTLMLAHFSIDTGRWRPPEAQRGGRDPGRPLRVLHAPNHREIKGSRHFIDAARRLREEGVAIELTILERVPNSEIRKAIAEADVVADQLIVGWYAMFALEAMSMGKPVICYLREDFLHFYEAAGLVHKDEIPIINCRPADVVDTLRRLATTERDTLGDLGARGVAFVNKHHSVEAVGRVFDRINRSLGVLPSSAGTAPDARANGSMERRS
ncbi:MAG: hypothetical protein A3I02_01465 [Betaproteobacteria bacterium RIFCSPLOWO2_02_FULL_67_26]|nr:MAG: hypothetical protein A3I02_01465 [Betaproteobacteria bacterium RIFCSPLOWO2_02_FULL_67_26]